MKIQMGSIKYLLAVLFLLYLSYIFIERLKFEVKATINSTLLLEENTSNNRKLYLKYEYSLCTKFIPENDNRAKEECPKEGIVTVVQGGRLGNQIWEYIAVFVISKKTGLKPYVPQCIVNRLNEIFENLTIPTFAGIKHCPVMPYVSIGNINDYNKSSKIGITINKYNSQPELLSTYYNEVRQELKIKKTLLNKAQNVLQSAQKYYKHTFDWFISIHVRRTDYISHLKNRYNMKPANATYFLKAIDYFKQKYNNTIFIVVTDDPKWCKKQFKLLKHVYITADHMKKKEISPEVDMSILASCNHSIFDYGTYGQWGAILAGGETIYSKMFQTYLSERLSTVLKNWHPIDF